MRRTQIWTFFNTKKSVFGERNRNCYKTVRRFCVKDLSDLLQEAEVSKSENLTSFSGF